MEEEEENPQEIQMTERNPPITIRENNSISSNSNLELLTEAISGEQRDPTIESISDETDLAIKTLYPAWDMLVTKTEASA